MAKAKRLAPKAPTHTVRLDLTEEEAQTLWATLRAVGGDPRKSRRKDADTIMQALEPHIVGSGHELDREHTGAIRFLKPDEMASRL